MKNGCASIRAIFYSKAQSLYLEIVVWETVEYMREMWVAEESKKGGSNYLMVVVAVVHSYPAHAWGFVEAPGRRAVAPCYCYSAAVGVGSVETVVAVAAEAQDLAAIAGHSTGRWKMKVS